MKYIAIEEDDLFKFQCDDNGVIHEEEIEFFFNGFQDEIHPYHQKQLDFAIKVLKSSGIILNVTTVNTVDDMSIGESCGELDFFDISVPNDLIVSDDGISYCLLRDKEMGRGWAVLYKIENNIITILEQDHRDNVLDTLMKGEFIRSFWIDYKYVNN